MRKNLASKIMSVMLALMMVLTCCGASPLTAKAASYALQQDFNSTYQKTSSTAKCTTNGVWSSAYSSSLGSNHVSYQWSSTGYNNTNSLKLYVADGRYTINFYVGFSDAVATDELKFKTFIPSGSTITKINKISVNGTQIKGATDVKQGSWVEINAGEVGATDGYVEFEFYSATAAKGQYFYLDDVTIGGERYVMNQDFESGTTRSATPMDTTHGRWSSAYSSSTAKDHVGFYLSSGKGYNGSKALKMKVTDGRYTIDFYMGFQNVSKTDKLVFKTYIPSNSTISKINKITVNGTQIMGAKTVKKGSWVTVDAGALGATSGYVQFEFYSASAAVGQYFYLDDVQIISTGKTSSSTTTNNTTTNNTTTNNTTTNNSTTSSSSSQESSSDDDYINMGYLPYYRTSCYKTLDYDALTHMCLAFFNPDSSLEITDKFSSSTEIKNIISKAHSNGVKVLASYGGASGKAAYKEILKDSAKRTQVVKNMIAHALEYDFDGIDIDIEASESDSYIWDYYSAFITDLRTACDKEGLLLTTATADWYADAITSSTLKKFDIVGVMAYDDGGANHSSYEMAVDMVEYFVDRGVSKSKIVMGLPFYGYQTNTDRVGEKTYKEILASDASAYNKDYSNGMAYNGIPTIQKKCSYVMNNGYAGVMIWELGQDSASKETSLLNAIKLTVYGADGAR